MTTRRRTPVKRKSPPKPTVRAAIKKAKPVTPPAITNLRRTVKNWVEAKITANAAEAKQKDLKTSVEEMMVEQGLDEFEMEVDGRPVKIAYITGEADVLDLESFRSDIGEDAFDALCVKTFSESLLENAVKNGAIAAADVKKHTTKKARTPYAKITKGV
jgi:hypothetical protein